MPNQVSDADIIFNRFFKSYDSFIPTAEDVFRNPRPVLEVRELYIQDILSRDPPRIGDGSSELRHFRTLRPTANPDFGALFGEKRVVLAESEKSGIRNTATNRFIDVRLQFVLESVGEGTPRVGFGWDEFVYDGDHRTRRQSPLPTNRDIFERGLPLQVKRIRYKTNSGHGVYGEDLTVALLQPDGKYEVATPVNRKISEMDDSAIVVKSPQGIRAWVPHYVNVSIGYVKPSDVTLYVPTS
ncbi:MAG: hypothetical protein HYW22_02215 [Candidatus Aenigmarchaeota archaeon]|nr:hypothetical protein [Candidatus Aenigmarchaeota archaeon]